MAQGLAQQQQQQLRKQEISPYCLIPSYHIWGSTVVLPAAEPKGPLTLVRTCVRCCPALWDWGRTAVRFVREAKAPRWANFFFSKRVMAACGSSALFMNATPRAAFCRHLILFSPSLIG